MSRRPRRQQGGGGTGTVLFLVGCSAVLGTAFIAGLYTGQYLSWASAPRRAASSIDSETRSLRGPRPPAEPAPTLTFYRELTAPLGTPPPPAPRPRRIEPPSAGPDRPPARADGAGEGGEPLRAELPARSPAVAGADAREDRQFTVQVAAYRARPPADALRATLAAAGHEAYIAESDGAAAPYRVRVGSFASRAAADAAAARLRAERQLQVFVTMR